MPDRIGNLLSQPLSSYGINKESQAAFVCFQYNKLISELYGKKFDSRVQAMMFRNQELHVHVESSVWASELKLRQAEILREFAKKNPGHQHRIERVRYIVGQMSEIGSEQAEK